MMPVLVSRIPDRISATSACARRCTSRRSTASASPRYSERGRIAAQCAECIAALTVLSRTHDRAGLLRPSQRRSSSPNPIDRSLSNLLSARSSAPRCAPGRRSRPFRSDRPSAPARRELALTMPTASPAWRRAASRAWRRGRGAGPAQGRTPRTTPSTSHRYGPRPRTQRLHAPARRQATRDRPATECAVHRPVKPAPTTRRRQRRGPRSGGTRAGSVASHQSESRW